MVIICLWRSHCLDAVERFNLLIEITNHCISQRCGASKKIKIDSAAISILFYDKKVIDPLKILFYLVLSARHSISVLSIEYDCLVVA